MTAAATATTKSDYHQSPCVSIKATWYLLVAALMVGGYAGQVGHASLSDLRRKSDSVESTTQLLDQRVQDQRVIIAEMREQLKHIVSTVDRIEKKIP